MHKYENIFFFSRFQLSDKGGGGCRRELQIAQTLSKLNFKFISGIKANYPMDFWTKIRVKKLEDPYWHEDLWRYVERLRLFSEKWAKKIYTKSDLMIISDPIFFKPIVEKASKCGVKMVATCTNIESLSPSQINTTHQNELLQIEFNLLAKVDLIITISREETFLLNNLMLPTFYFPYYPVESIHNRLLKIREKRRNNKKSGILLLGTVNNLSTREGFKEVIQYWNEKAGSRIQQPLIVAGYGTDKLDEIGTGEFIQIRGPVSNLELDEIMSSVSAGLCFQRNGAGALTRICEMLIAGIPVIANFHSARSYYQTDGLYEFNELSELEEILKHITRHKINIPIPASPDSRLLLKKINNLIDLDHSRVEIGPVTRRRRVKLW